MQPEFQVRELRSSLIFEHFEHRETLEIWFEGTFTDLRLYVEGNFWCKTGEKLSCGGEVSLYLKLGEPRRKIEGLLPGFIGFSGCAKYNNYTRSKHYTWADVEEKALYNAIKGLKEDAMRVSMLLKEI